MKLKLLSKITTRIQYRLQTRYERDYIKIYDEKFRVDNLKKWEQVWNEIQAKPNHSISKGLLLLKDHNNKVIKSLWIDVQGQTENFGRLLIVRYGETVYDEIDEYVELAMEHEFPLEVDIYKNDRVLIGTIQVNVDAMWELKVWKDKHKKYLGRTFEYLLIDSITIYDTNREKLNRIKELNL